VLLALIGSTGWMGTRIATRHAGAADPTRRRAADSAASSVSATIPLQGELTANARAALVESTRGGAAILVLLDSVDIRVCEDLGRQLRELRYRAGPTLPLIIGTDSAALAPIRAFARRERLRPSAFASLDAREVIEGMARLPTPAALVIYRGSAEVAGISHPLRFPNVRVRSFADELSAYLREATGSTSPPDSRRSQ